MPEGRPPSANPAPRSPGATAPSDRFLAAIVESSDDAIITKTLDGTIASWNRGAELLYGHTAAEAVGQPISLIIPPDLPDELPGIMERLRRGERIDHYETVRVRKDGSRLEVSVSIAPVRDEAGRIVGAASIGREITERKRVERERRELELRAQQELAARRESEARLQALVEQLPVGVGLADADGRWLLANAALRRFVGDAIPSRDPERLPCWRAWDADGREVPPSDWPGARALRGETVPGMEFLVDVGGEGVWIRFGAAPFRDAVGNLSGVVAIIEDIDARKRAAEERVAFVDAAAHDLRNPLTTLKGQAQLLRRRARRAEPVDAATLATRLAPIDEAVDRMAALLDEMLDAAHLQAGRALDLRRASADLVVLAEAAAEEARRRSTRHVIQVVAAAATLVGDWDGARLERVLANLVGNAVKYSPEGGTVVVGVNREADAAGAWAVVTVRDQGIGIPAADLPHLFERFHRGHNVGGIRGTGIGLAGAKRIIEQHGGTIAATSTEGQGSTVTVRLPLDWRPLRGS